MDCVEVLSGLMRGALDGEGAFDGWEGQETAIQSRMLAASSYYVGNSEGL